MLGREIHCALAFSSLDFVFWKFKKIHCAAFERARANTIKVIDAWDESGNRMQLLVNIVSQVWLVKLLLLVCHLPVIKLVLVLHVHLVL